MWKVPLKIVKFFRNFIGATSCETFQPPVNKSQHPLCKSAFLKLSQRVGSIQKSDQLQRSRNLKGITDHFKSRLDVPTDR